MTNMQGFCCDDETGEIITFDINKETGEPHLESLLPPAYLPTRHAIEDLEPAKKYIKFPKGYVTNTKKFQLLKANILAGSNPISHRMLLIPTLMVCPGLLCIILMVLEIILHVRCHKKNKSLKDTNLYYRSPFHVVTSIFCGVCRDCDTASKIGQLQDQRRFRYDYLRGIAI